MRSSVLSAVALTLVLLVSLSLLRVAWQPSSPPTPTEQTAEPFGAKPRNEVFYTQLIARQLGWRAEVRTSIGTRCDLVSEQHCVEVEWPSRKCFESVGQVLHYSRELGKSPAILFLLSEKSPLERSFVLERIGDVAVDHGIEIWWFDTTTEHLSKEAVAGNTE